MKVTIQFSLLSLALLTYVSGCSHGSKTEGDREIAREWSQQGQGQGSSRCPSDWKDKLVIHHIDVGQGDSTFIRTPSGTTILIDAGLPKNGKAEILPVLKNCYKTDKIDYAVLTHPHNDHFGGFSELLESNQLEIGKFYDTGNHSEAGKMLTKLYELLEKRRVPREIPALGDGDFGDDREVSFKVVAANGMALGSKKNLGKKSDPNSLSIALVMKFKKFDYFIGGDLTGGGDRSPDLESLVANVVGDVDVYHSNHHGSKTSNNAALLRALKPEQVVISVGVGGTNKGYRLPNAPAIKNMMNAGADNIFMTSRGESEDVDFADYPKLKSLDGDIIVVSDGYNYTVQGVRGFEQNFNTDGH